MNIQEFIDRDYATDVRKNRRKGKGGTQEFCTPYSIIKRMCDKIPDDEWADPEKTFLEPCMGDGNIVCYIIWNRIQHGIDWQTALKTLGGVELMADNVKETKERVIDLLDKMNITYDKETAMEIMDKNLVCADFFNWDFEHWRPIPEKPKKYKNPQTKQLSLFEE